MKNEKGFTLIEMLIVLMVISVILLITIPNVTKNNQVIESKGCDALIKMVEAQVQAYELETNITPTIAELVTGEYLKEEPVCPNGADIIIDADGKVRTEENSES